MHPEPTLHKVEAGGGSVGTVGTLAIRDVSALLGVPAPTIRSWERRHSLPTGGRDERGQRRYTPGDVAVLRRMRDHRTSGARADQAAAVAATPDPMALCQQMLAAVALFDEEAMTAVLDASHRAYGLAETVDEVLLPSMREVGERWSRGVCDIAQEHLATSTVQAWLSRHAAATPPPRDDRPIVLACGPQDHHTIALTAFIALLRHERFRCLDLGAQTPADALCRAVERSSARAVVLVSQLPRNRAAARSALEGVSGTGAALFYAGAAFRTAASRHHVPGHYLGGNLTQAATYVTTFLRHA